MLAAGRGVKPGHVAGGGVASLIDLCPTLLTAAGLDVPGHVQGSDLSPALSGDGPPPPHAIIDATKDGAGVVTPTHIYGLPRRDDLRVDREADAIQFDDLTSDPLQHVTAPAHDDPSALRAALLAWDDRTPVVPPNA